MDYSKLNNIAASIQDVENATSIVENRLNTKIDEDIQTINEKEMFLDLNSKILISNETSGITGSYTNKGSFKREKLYIISIVINCLEIIF